MASDLTGDHARHKAAEDRIDALERRIGELERRLGGLLSGEPRPYPPGQEPRGIAT